MFDRRKYIEHVGYGMRVAIILCLLGLVLISIINLASGVDIAPWWFYILVVTFSFAFWKLASIFIGSRD